MRKKWKQKAIACFTALAMVGTLLPQNPFGIVSKNVEAAVDGLGLVYLNDFENGLGDDCRIVGSGEIKDDPTNSGQGKIFHNAVNNKAIRANYMVLPDNILVDAVKVKGELTISMDVNVGTAEIADDYFHAPLFSAYAKQESPNNVPMMIIQSRGIAQVNCNGWTNFSDDENEKGKNVESTAYLDAGEWHRVTVTFTKEKAVYYIDKEPINTWNINGGLNGFLTETDASQLKYICLGGNQAWDWADKDAAYYFDNLAIYSNALTKAQVEQICSEKVTKITITPDKPTVTNKYICDKNGNVLESECASVKLSASIEPSTAFNKSITWSIADADKEKAEVDETGKVTLTDKVTSEDNTIVVNATANDGSGVTSSCTITASVESTQEATSVEKIEIADQSLNMVYQLDKTNHIVNAGDESVTPEIKYTPANPSVKGVDFTTAQTDVIKIEGNKITPLKAGTATVSAISKSSSKADTTFTVKVSGELGTLTSDFTAGAGINAIGSGFEKISGNYNILYRFNNETTGTELWDNFVFRVADGNGKLQTFRADRWGFGDYVANGDITWTGDLFSLEDMANANVIVNAIRKDNTLDVKYHITTKENKVYNITAHSEIVLPNDLYVHISGENVIISNITLENNTSFPIKTSVENATIEDLATDVTIGDAIEFNVTPDPGYRVTKVCYDGKEVPKDEKAEKQYKIPFITDADTIEVTAEPIEYTISYVVDGKNFAIEEKVTVEKAEKGMLPLKDAGTINGWYQTEDDKTNIITGIDITTLDTFTDNEIIVYGYQPYNIIMDEKNPTSFKYGTIETLDTSEPRYMGDKVIIITEPNEGFTANVTISYKVDNETIQNKLTAEPAENGKENLTFTMPAADVTITYGEFTGIDKSGLETAIASASAIYEGENKNAIYTTESWDAFKKAYDAAIVAKDNKDSTQGEIDTAKNALIKAQDELAYIYNIDLDKKSETITVGESFTLTATVTTESDEKDVTWTSSDSEIAKVENGTVTAIAPGEATITAATIDNTTAQCIVTVIPAEVEPTTPESTYLFDFEGELTKDGTPVTNGIGKVEIINDDERGRVLHITDGGTESYGKNYYKLPEDVFRGVTEETGASVSMWVKIPDTIAKEWSVLFNSTPTAYNEWGVWKINANLASDINAGAPWAFGGTQAQGVPEIGWHNVVMTLKIDALSVYLDGKLVSTGKATGGDASYAEDGWIGPLKSLANNKFNVLGAGGFPRIPATDETGDRDISDCYYDDVAIYSTALTAEEVESLYNATKTLIKVEAIAVTPETATASNEYVYANEEDKEAGKIYTARYGSVQFQATVTPSTADNKDVTWTIDKASEGKATVDAKGLVTLTDKAEEGDSIKVYATAKDGSEVNGTATIKVSIIETVGAPKTEELEAAIAAAAPIYNETNEEAIYTADSWDAFKEAYDAAIEAKEAITQGEVNEATTALIEAQEALAYVYIIKLDKTEATVKVGETIELIATVTTAGGIDKDVTWTSSDEKIATVTDGKVTAVAVGEATITAAARDNTTAVCKITVVQNSDVIAVTEISLNKKELLLNVGDSETLIATITPENASNKAVQWNSKNEGVAVVDESGKVTAVAAGTAVIQVTAAADSTIATECAVTVNQVTTPITPTTPSSSSSGGSSSSTNTTPENTNDSNTNTDSNQGTNTPTAPSTTTKEDGTVVETQKETMEDGTVKETVKETAVDGAVKETVTETAANGAVKETVTETTADSSVTKETVTETAANGAVTMKATVDDQKNAAVLTAVVEKDADGKVVKADAVISAGAAATQVNGKKATVTVNVSDVIMNTAAENEDINSVVIEITKPVLSSAYENKNVTNGVTVNVNIDTVDNVDISGIVLTSDSIAEAKAAGQKLTVNVTMKNKDNADYKVVIPAKQLKKITDTTKPVDIMVETIAADKLSGDSSKSQVASDMETVLAKSKAKKAKTYVLSVAENENLTAGMKITAGVDSDTTISANQTVYVYKYNKKTGKFVEVANSKQKVSSDGKITIDAKSGTDYVVSSKKLSGNKVTTIKSQITATGKSSVKAGKNVNINVTLPSTLKKVKSFGGSSTFGKEKAIVLYESSNKKIATVTANGTIKTKKAGDVTITITVGMEGGQTKKIKKNITVK